MGGSKVEGFDAHYAGTPLWDLGRPQTALRDLAEAGAFRGRVLDVGCGTGEVALMAAALGLPTVGIDSASTAIGIARRKAEERGLPARFLVGDALNSATWASSSTPCSTAPCSTRSARPNASATPAAWPP
ncbi:class I SAM-dependent methyltransferase [Streptomyces rubradiris]|uniref:Methyltransferase domain-containing protein n=1 Tax=Streptomyces rubradiris TaxID=285531 RepID=A0ABQ3RAL2_STRRR|nr:class I SAM-dependent methyltransferase [Streptomyces rubradiris]GHH30961.1 hypothetical protein GCM10018792_78210 [Streptomyces rubradiris]GHI51976.1 hypothetical protein Srubr_18220 [Streptomyces rubradiris]GHI52024.1 hypothetical protein Srubr_18700 [Streptomyces rubradiris]GHI52678.1 hypothetical protein Srubr_25240 [Streptomyces rubradiris]GHI52689.1 hypothetical protein Srubr_25350 [Streptomyces rubradiris]